MLNVEGLVFKLWGGAVAPTSLHEHAFDNSVDLAAAVARLLFILPVLASLDEALAGISGKVVEKFEDDLVLFRLTALLPNAVVDVHAGVRSLGVVVDGGSHGFFRFIHVDSLGRLVQVGKIVQHVLHETVTIANVFAVVKVHEWRTLMLVENSFLFTGDLSYKFVPLSLEELEHL